MSDAWPFAGLSLQCGDVELRLPTDPEVEVLAVLAEETIVPAGREDWLPFLKERPTERNERLRNVMRFHWSMRAALSIDDWHLAFAIYHRRRIVGTISMYAKQFSARRVVRTGSWVVGREQRQGIGTTARAMLIELSFHYLMAEYMESSYVKDNVASGWVSNKLGYQFNGISVDDRCDPPPTLHHMILTRPGWQTVRPAMLNDMSVAGVEPCLPLLIRQPQEPLSPNVR